MNGLKAAQRQYDRQLPVEVEPKETDAMETLREDLKTYSEAIEIMYQFDELMHNDDDDLDVQLVKALSVNDDVKALQIMKTALFRVAEMRAKAAE